MPQIGKTVTRSLAVLGILAGSASGGFADGWRFSPSVIPGGMSAASGPAGAEVEVSCRNAKDVKVTLYYTGLGARTVMLSMRLDQEKPEKLPLKCQIGVCDLGVAQGGPARLVSRLLSAQQIAFEAQLDSDEKARELDVIQLGNSAGGLQEMAQECGIAAAGSPS